MRSRMADPVRHRTGSSEIPSRAPEGAPGPDRAIVARMLIACPSCHRQYDVGALAEGSRVRCQCGELCRVPDPRRRERVVMRHCSLCGGSLGEGEAACGYCGAGVDADRERNGDPCPECFGELGDEDAFCSSCGTEIRPEDILRAVTDDSCPECAEPLLVCESDSGSFHECGECCGIWLSTEAFERFAASRQEQAPKPKVLPDAIKKPLVPVRPSRRRGGPRPRTVRCPVCSAYMLRHEFAACSGVTIDRCRAHGYWFDEGELDEIGRFIQAGGLHVAEDRGKVAARARARRARRRRTKRRKEEAARNAGLLGLLVLLLET